MSPARRYAAVGLLSAAVVAFQLSLMEIFAIVQWHHFAYMVISVALLGFGAAGTALALFRKFLPIRYDRGVPLLMLLCGPAMAVATGITQHPAVRFDSFLLFTEATQAVRLFLTYGVLFTPFFLAALAIGWTFTQHSRNIGRLYFWNLAGSGVGGLAALVLMWVVPPAALPAILASLPLAGGLLALPRRPGGPLAIAAMLAALCVAAAILRPPSLVPSEYKSLSRAAQLPGAEIVEERGSPYGLLQVLSSPALRYAPGLSLSYPDDVPARPAVFNNGDWVGPLPAAVADRGHAVMDYSTAALPYALAPRRTALVLDMGTGAHVAQAIDRGVSRVTAVEPNPLLPALLAAEPSGSGERLLRHPAVTLVRTASRTRIMRDTAVYDLIVLPTIDTFGGTAGLDAIREHFLFTVEAFGDAWRRLSPRGVLTATCWMDYPPRHALKLAATLAEMLAAQGIDQPHNHIAAVRSWGTITFMVKKTPYTTEEIRAIRGFCRTMGFDPALLPGISASERAVHNILQDDRFFVQLDELLSRRRADAYAAYDFRIAPATDDRPYFAQFLRWRSLPNIAAHFGGRTVPFFEIGYLVVFLTLLQTVPAALLLILVPLVPASRPPRGKARIFLYFSGIGLGYLFVEMAMIQRFTLYLGNPIASAAVVIGAMLFASGLGSYASERFASFRASPSAVLAVIAVLTALAGLFLTPLLLKTIALPPTAKLLVSLSVLFPLAFLMGVPFPVGIRALAETNEAAIPWAWGINGCFSVIGTVLATIIAVEAGCAALLICASLAYGATLAAPVAAGADR